MALAVMVVFITLYLSPGTVAPLYDDGLSYLRNNIYKKDAECDSLYVSSPFAGVDAERAQQQAEDRYRDCISDLSRLAENYIIKKANNEGKSVEDWLRNPKNDEVYFSKSTDCYVLKATTDYGKKPTTYVYLPTKYNPTDAVWEPKMSKPKKDETYDDRLGPLRNEIYREKMKCDSLYVSSQFGGVDANRAQELAEKRYRDCIDDLAGKVEDYIKRKARFERKSVEKWLLDPEDDYVYFSMSAGCYVLKVTTDYGKHASTYVYLPAKYNPSGYAWEQHIPLPKKVEHDRKSPVINPTGLPSEYKEERRKGLKAKFKAMLSWFSDIFSWLVPRRNKMSENEQNYKRY